MIGNAESVRSSLKQGLITRQRKHQFQHKDEDLDDLGSSISSNVLYQTTQCRAMLARSKMLLCPKSNDQTPNLLTSMVESLLSVISESEVPFQTPA